MNQPLVSVIMPAYNAEKFIFDAVQSVINQTYQNWELLLTNDGSTDNTKDILTKFSDQRIKIINQPNSGVSVARNASLKQVKGIYLTYLDADDLLPPKSLEMRVHYAELNPNVDMLAGCVYFFEKGGFKKRWEPSFRGNPIRSFTRIDGRAFCNPSLFLRIKPGVNYQFKEGMTHLEDLLFFYSISCQQPHQYDYILEDVYHYRLHENSTMKNLEGLESGYWTYYDYVKQNTIVAPQDKLYLKSRVVRIMVLSYLKKGKLYNALKSLYKLLL